jgi:hypothetical protein
LFTVGLSGAVNATVADGRGSVVIGAGDAPVTAQPAISAPPDVVVGEGGGFVDLVVGLSAPSLSVVSVDYATVNSSAGAGTVCNSDYVAVAGTLTFAPGETTKVVRVELLNCPAVENLESFTFRLSAAINATIARTSGSVTIVDGSGATPTFADVPPANVFYDFIERLFDLGITTGCGINAGGQLLFCPTVPVPRQQMAAFLIRAKGLTQLFSPTPTFADVPVSNPFYGHIERLFQAGITTGCGTNGAGALIYCPSDSVLRQQMAAFLIRAFAS